jgi:integrase/recombinase XerD
MASTKLILRTDKKNKQGLCPLYLRIIRHRKTTFVFLGIRLKEGDWDKDNLKVKKSHKNSGRMNANIAQKVADAEALIVDTETKVKNVSARRLKEKIIGIEPVDFLDYSKRYTDSLLAGNQIATYKRAMAVIQKLKDYNDEKPLYLEDITHIFLQDFADYCKTDLENKPNTIHGNLRIIRKIINDAIRDDKMSRDDNPFLKMTLRSEPSKRSYLTNDEIQAIENLNLEGKKGLQSARNVFIFACYAGGVENPVKLTT